MAGGGPGAWADFFREAGDTQTQHCACGDFVLLKEMGRNRRQALYKAPPLVGTDLEDC